MFFLPSLPSSHPSLDCKTVRIFAYSSTREQSNKRSGTRLKTESETKSETGEGRVRLARFARIRLLLHALPISLLILRKKPTVLQSNPTPLKNLVLLKQLKSCTVTTSMIHLNFSYFYVSLRKVYLLKPHFNDCLNYVQQGIG